MKQKVTADNRVELPTGIEIKEVRVNKFNIRATRLLTDPCASFLNGDTVAINSSHATSGSNEHGGQQRNIPHSTPQVKHSHSGLDSGRQQKLLSPSFNTTSLQLQALLFLRAIPQSIVLKRMVRPGHLEAPQVIRANTFREIRLEHFRFSSHRQSRRTHVESINV